MPFCSKCGADVTGTQFCSKCGAPQGESATPPQAQVPPQAQAGGDDVPDNVLGVIAYMTPIPAIIFLLLEPYKTNPFVRFHSFQMIFFCLACFVLSTVATILGVALSFVGMTSIFAFLGIIINMGSMVVWLILVLKAYQGETFKLPIIGDFAAKQAQA